MIESVEWVNSVIFFIAFSCLVYNFSIIIIGNCTKYHWIQGKKIYAITNEKTIYYERMKFLSMKKLLVIVIENCNKKKMIGFSIENTKLRHNEQVKKIWLRTIEVGNVFINKQTFIKNHRKWKKKYHWINHKKIQHYIITSEWISHQEWVKHAWGWSQIVL